MHLHAVSWLKHHYVGSHSGSLQLTKVHDQRLLIYLFEVGRILPHHSLTACQVLKLQSLQSMYDESTLYNTVCLKGGSPVPRGLHCWYVVAKFTSINPHTTSLTIIQCVCPQMSSKSKYHVQVIEILLVTVASGRTAAE